MEMQGHYDREQFCILEIEESISRYVWFKRREIPKGHTTAVTCNWKKRALVSYNRYQVENCQAIRDYIDKIIRIRGFGVVGAFRHPNGPDPVVEETEDEEEEHDSKLDIIINMVRFCCLILLNKLTFFYSSKNKERKSIKSALIKLKMKLQTPHSCRIMTRILVCGMGRGARWKNS